MTNLELSLTPVAKPRMTQSDKWKQRPEVVKYRRYCAVLNLMCNTQGYRIGDELEITFVLPMPKSWPQAVRDAQDGKPHRSRPDLSNLVKAFEDALCPKDETIHTYRSVRKVWGKSGKIVIHLPG